MKVLFLDESGDHSLIKIDKQFPVFCLAGCIFDDKDYQETDCPLIDNFKNHYFKTADTILHSREIRKAEPPFNILLNPKKRLQFYIDLNALMESLHFTAVASVILKQKLRDKFSDPANPYMISLQFIMERFLYFLEEANDVGYISVESRDPKANTDLLGSFTEIMNNGSKSSNHSIEAERFQNKIQRMDFVTKKQNQNGHQIADLIAYPIAKYAMDNIMPNPASEVLKSRFRAKKGSIIGYGLKIFP